jgi:hypothetical protein
MKIGIEKLISALVVAASIAVYYHSYYSRCHALGRDGYLAYQANHFDMYMANPAWGYPLYEGLIVAVVAIALYEGVSAGLGRLINKTSQS